MSLDTKNTKKDEKEFRTAALPPHAAEGWAALLSGQFNVRQPSSKTRL